MVNAGKRPKVTIRYDYVVGIVLARFIRSHLVTVTSSFLLGSGGTGGAYSRQLRPHLAQPNPESPEELSGIVTSFHNISN